MGIPEDVQKSAEDLAYRVRGFVSYDARSDCPGIDFEHSEIEALIARAILAERKRCAEVARGEAHEGCDVAEQIAKAIEAGA